MTDQDLSDQTLDIAGASDIGRNRNENQDHYLIAKLRRQLVICDSDVPCEVREAHYGCPEGRLLVVADGMGGHRDGERASRIAVTECARYILDLTHWFLKLSPDDEDDFLEELADSLLKIQDKIWLLGNGSERGMGTTVTMAYLVWPKLYLVHAGDSRCYLLRDGGLRQMTTDHTLAQKLVESGGLSREDASESRWRHVLWNCVGGGKKRVEPEVVRWQLREDDVVLLCSDGLTGMVDDEELRLRLSQGENSEVIVKQLINAANEAGGNDNISVIACRVLHPPDCGEDAHDATQTTIVE